MFNATIVFKNVDGSVNLHHECAIPALPKVGDFLGLEDPLDRPFKTALAKVENVFLVVNPTKLGVYQNQALIVAKLLILLETALTVETLTL